MSIDTCPQIHSNVYKHAFRWPIELPKALTNPSRRHWTTSSSVVAYLSPRELSTVIFDVGMLALIIVLEILIVELYSPEFSIEFA